MCVYIYIFMYICVFSVSCLKFPSPILQHRQRFGTPKKESDGQRITLNATQRYLPNSEHTPQSSAALGNNRLMFGWSADGGGG